MPTLRPIKGIADWYLLCIACYEIILVEEKGAVNSALLKLFLFVVVGAIGASQVYVSLAKLNSRVM